MQLLGCSIEKGNDGVSAQRAIDDSPSYSTSSGRLCIQYSVQEHLLHTPRRPFLEATYKFGFGEIQRNPRQIPDAVIKHSAQIIREYL